MGLLVKEMQKVDGKYSKVKGDFKKLFSTEGSGRRINDLDGVIFSSRSAVVVCGISGIGKTTFIDDFMSEHPDFVMCSMDEATYRVAAKFNRMIKPKDESSIMSEFEKDFRNKIRHGGKVIFDGTFSSIVNRAAVLNTLRALGYTTYVIFYSERTMNEMFKKCCLSRAVGIVLSMEYLHLKSDEGKSIADNLEVTKNIFKILERETGKTREEFVRSMKDDERVIGFVDYLQDLAEQEKKRNRIQYQLYNRVFTYGTDYYHVI